MIKAIFLSEFDYDKGPKITFFHPEQSKYEAMVTQTFDEFTFFICPEANLCGKLLSLNQNEKYILIGWPHEMKSSSYTRAKIQYNTNFVIKKSCLQIYELSLERLFKKLALFFAEVEREYNQFSNSSNRHCLQTILNNIYRDLNNKLECMIRIEKHFVFLNLVPSDETLINKIDQTQYLLPVMKKNIDHLTSEIEGRDVMLIKIFSYINSRTTNEKIREKVLEDIKDFCPNEINLDKLIIKKLILLEHAGQIFFTDIYSLKNVYIINYPQFKKCKEDIDILFMEFLNKLRMNKEKMTEPVIAKNVLCKFFQTFDGQKPLFEVRNIFYKVFEKQVKFLWCFGHYHKLFKRLYEYPTINLNTIDPVLQEKSLKKFSAICSDDVTNGKDILEKFNGNINKDQIIDKLQINEEGYYKILSKIENDFKQNLIVYYKPNNYSW